MLLFLFVVPKTETAYRERATVLSMLLNISISAYFCSFCCSFSFRFYWIDNSGIDLRRAEKLRVVLFGAPSVNIVCFETGAIKVLNCTYNYTYELK